MVGQNDDPLVETNWGSNGENCCNLFNAKVEWPRDRARCSSGVELHSIGP